MKKALKIVLAVLGLGLAVYAFCLYMNYHVKQIEHKKNEQIIQQKNNNFSVDKIVAYSSASAYDKRKYSTCQLGFVNLSVYRFCYLY